ncbi:hypothetical protein AYO20_01170 [Fonsecaea nubica]|uniref:Major facilitator superfamily (MFS) profile domain-containing protein n=1 Tax=Fonsecaea nubica TaxID=856822 RepID=A0A178DEY2_9EURO|nr:hypothetical protein AYO20_01170 [Fonsecaea nubica]OAL39773.1 hypothetical protein AYO20_01170 [Fonsecaea nubica]
MGFFTDSQFDDTVPGTLVLVDIDHRLDVRHAKGNKSDVVLHPAPTDDPDDPLNWSRWRKLAQVICVNMYTFMISYASGVHYSIIGPISKSRGIPVSSIVSAQGYLFLLMGWGNLIWIPMAQKYGKRPMYLLSLITTLGIMLWLPHISSGPEWIASKILQGFVGAPVETLIEISIADVFFVHERAKHMGIYASMVFIGSKVASFLAGFIFDGQGWEWVPYWCVIFMGLSIVFCFFFLEESNYVRPAPQESVAPTISTGLAEDPEAASKEVGVQISTTATSTSSGESRAPKPFWSRLKLFRKPEKVSWQLMVLRPLKLFRFPIVCWSGFTYGSFLCLYTFFQATVSLVFSGEPYNFSAGSIGITYLAPLVAGLVAMLYCGPFESWAVLRIVRRRSGIWLAEDRLWLLLICVVTSPGCCLLWGLGAAYEVHWFGLVFATFLLGFSISVGASLAITYCIDSYKEIGSEAIVTVMLIRNTTNFAFSYGTSPWLSDMGYRNAYILAAVLFSLQALTTLPMIKFGPRLRKASQDKYQYYIEQDKDHRALH